MKHSVFIDGAAGTTGLDSATYDATPFTVPAGTSVQHTATARLTATPGTTSNLLVVDTTGHLGANPSGVKPAATSDITSTEAVSGTLTATDDGDGNAATVDLPDEITYKLHLANGSDTPVQISGVPAGFVAPMGTTFVSRVDGSTTIAAHGSRNRLR